MVFPLYFFGSCASDSPDRCCALPIDHPFFRLFAIRWRTVRPLFLDSLFSYYSWIHARFSRSQKSDLRSSYNILTKYD